ncbi:hypothetical protein [Spartinivicinus ruber]|uniref:hypothetical protein n=1 Tax=Spartinivicinus ruber TaxID=2683272 RepID=UPI0013D56AD9|nr:hypothetical protein [Spartinivicinus ruber]
MLNNSYYSETAYRGHRIPRQRPYSKKNGILYKMQDMHTKMALRLPWGNYANIDSAQIIDSGFEIANDPERKNPESFAKKVSWNHECLKIDNSHWLLEGLAFLTAVFGSRFVIGITLIVVFLVGVETYITKDRISDFIITILFCLLLIHLISYYVMPIFLEKIEQFFVVDRGCGFFRKTGMVRKHVTGKQYFEAPFTEFDATLINMPDINGLPRYQLTLVHRYQPISFNVPIGLEGVLDGRFRLADWDTLQRFMDISQPLPDIPQLEPFRALDPVTSEYDKAGKRGRPDDYWANISHDEWFKNHEPELLKAITSFHWQGLKDYMAGKVPGREEEDQIARRRWCSIKWKG